MIFKSAQYRFILCLCNLDVIFLSFIQKVHDAMKTIITFTKLYHQQKEHMHVATILQ